MKIGKFELDKIYCGDSEKLIKYIPDESIDLVLTDPPYFCGNKKFEIKEKSYKRINEEWDTFKSMSDYLIFIKKTFLECKRVLKNGGTILTTGTFHNAFDTHIILRDDIGLTFRNFITWFKSNAMPIKFAYLIGVYAYSCEYINYFTKGKTKTFNYNLAKELNNGKQQRDLLQYKVYSDVKTGHPTQKPLSLWEYLMKIHSNKNDIILDPFIGSGTTGKVAIKLKRHFLGFEIKSEYVEMANRGLESVQVSLL